MPWWLGRGVGLALLALVAAVGWATWWAVAAQVETTTPAAAPWWPEETAAVSPVSVPAERPSAAGAKAPAGTEASVGARASVVPESPEEPRGGVTAETVEPPPTTQALQAEVRWERQRDRERRALQADQELAEFIESVGVLDQLEAWVKPISGDYRITATFGQGGSLWSADHTGVDLAAPTGTPVASVGAGTVTDAGEAGAYGSRVEVTHTDGSVTSYSHLSRIDVVVGQPVQAGSVVGAVGSTGNSTGPHLHLELTPAGGSPIDPVHALLARGVII